jgi:hypothetical protein
MPLAPNAAPPLLTLTVAPAVRRIGASAFTLLLVDRNPMPLFVVTVRPAADTSICPLLFWTAVPLAVCTVMAPGSEPALGSNTSQPPPLTVAALVLPPSVMLVLPRTCVTVPAPTVTADVMAPGPT